MNGKVENSEFSENSETSENQFSEVFNSECSILHFTQNGKLGVENLRVLFQAFLPNYKFFQLRVFHFALYRKRKTRSWNLGVFSEVYQNSNVFKLLNQTLRFSNSEFSISHYTQNGKLGDGNLGV